MADPERTLEVLAGLRAIGVATALDDFGAGHASLGHLKALRVDELKIDRSFVDALPDDERDAGDRRTRRSTSRRRLGMRVVAEGVESAETWDALARLLCDEAQGFYLSRPLTATALAAGCATAPPYVNSGASPRCSVRLRISSSVGRSWKRSAASSSFGRMSTSPVVSRNACSLPSTQCAARSMSACSVSGSYQVAAVCCAALPRPVGEALDRLQRDVALGADRGQRLERLRVARVLHLDVVVRAQHGVEVEALQAAPVHRRAPTGRGR